MPFILIFRQYLLTILCCSFFISGLFFPVIISIKNIFLYTSLGFSCILVPWKHVLRQCKEEPFIASSLALFVLIAFSTLHSHAGSARAFSVLAKYRCLLYPFFLIPLFRRYSSLCASFIKGLFWSILLLLTITAGVFLFKLFYQKEFHYSLCFIYINPIYGSFVTAFIAYLALIYAFFKPSISPKQKYFYTFIFLGASCIILFFQQQRTGYFAYFFCMFCFIFSLYPRLSFRSRLSCLLACILVICLLPRLQTFSSRVGVCFENIFLYHYQQVIPFTPSQQATLLMYNNSTSIGERLVFWEQSLPYIQKKPFLGWGAGSFASVWVDAGIRYLYGIASFNSPSGIPNPHNQFLLLLFEQGLLGLVAFFVWLLSFIVCMFRKGWLSIGMAFTGAFVIGCWGDSLLFLNVTGNFFVMLCCCLVSLPKNHFQQAF